MAKSSRDIDFIYSFSPSVSGLFFLNLGEIPLRKALIPLPSSPAILPMRSPKSRITIIRTTISSAVPNLNKGIVFFSTFFISKNLQYNSVLRYCIGLVQVKSFSTKLKSNYLITIMAVTSPSVRTTLGVATGHWEAQMINSYHAVQ